MTKNAKKSLMKKVAKVMVRQFDFDLWEGFSDNMVGATEAEVQEVKRGVLIEVRKMIDKKLNQGG